MGTGAARCSLRQGNNSVTELHGCMRVFPPPRRHCPPRPAGAFGDWLNRVGGRHWLTAVGNCVAAPTIALSLLAPDYRQSFAALLVGFALSEAWRAPAAIMVREVSPPGLGSTGSAAHLCIRNLVGGLGPIGVALLSERVGLQSAMLLVPTCYLLSGVGFIAAEVILRREEAKERDAAAAALAAAAGGGGMGDGPGKG